MATASAKKTLPRRQIAPSTTSLGDSGDIVENTEPDKITLGDQSSVDAEEKVTAVVPKDYTLTRDDGAVVKYYAGTQEMPASDAAHWFSRSAGVKVYTPS